MNNYFNSFADGATRKTAPLAPWAPPLRFSGDGKEPRLRADLVELGQRKHVLLSSGSQPLIDGGSGPTRVQERGRFYSARVRETVAIAREDRNVEPRIVASVHEVSNASRALSPGAGGEHQPGSDTERRLLAEVAELLDVPSVCERSASR